jgi:hypothetical protein
MDLSDSFGDAKVLGTKVEVVFGIEVADVLDDFPEPLRIPGQFTLLYFLPN